MATRRVTAADIRRMGSEIIPVGDYTALIVEDTGGGIPPEVLPKIFDPFFTTKEMGKGTGLGLSTVYGIVKQSGGFIFADNVGEGAVIKGARFTIYLPVHHVDRAGRRARRRRKRRRAGRAAGAILLVEDEDMVRAVAERALARQGYEVTTASDGEEGLEKVRDRRRVRPRGQRRGDAQHGRPGDGARTAQDRPGLPVLFMSGYAEEQLRNEIDIENMHFIPKPFSVQQIANKVAEVLGASKQLSSISSPCIAALRLRAATKVDAHRRRSTGKQDTTSHHWEVFEEDRMGLRACGLAAVSATALLGAAISAQSNAAGPAPARRATSRSRSTTTARRWCRTCASSTSPTAAARIEFPDVSAIRSAPKR